MKIILYCCFLITSLVTPSLAEDVTTTMLPSDIPVEAFARLDDGEQMKMSPDATKVAYIVPYKGRKHIMVQKLDGSESKLLPPIKEADIKWFVWKGDDILLISYRYTIKNLGDTTPYTRLATYSLIDKKMYALIRPKGNSTMGTKERIGNVGDDIVDMLPEDPDHILLELDEDYDGDSAIFKINVHTRKRSLYFRGKFGLNDWAVDEQKIVRWGTGYHFNKRRVMYLNPETNKWEQVQDKDWYKKDSIYPIRFFEDPRYAYVHSPNEKGINGLAKFDMVEGKIVEEIFSHDIVDISGLATSPETGKVIGVEYTEHHPQIHFFNKGYETLYGRINRALGNGWVEIISMNMEKKTFLIRSMNSGRPAEYHFLNGKTGMLDFILSTNRDLPSELMATAKPVRYKARDGLTIHGYLTLPKGEAAKNLPTVIFPHGGPSSRDTMSFDSWAQLFASRGYAVLQPNFRGSTGYGDIFKNLGDNQWGGAMQDDVTDATNWLIKEGIADPEKICVAGASYGGYAALMGAAKEADLYKCAISINGVANLPRMMMHNRHFIGGKSWNKDISLNGEKTKSVSPYHRAKDIKIPVLIVHSKDDSVVPYKQGKDMYKRLKSMKKPVTYVEVDNGDHFLDTAETRLAAFKAMEKFLAKHIGN